MSEVFETTRLLRHGHTDPAGFAFYPRYYEMVAEVIEDFFREILGRPFGKMHLQQRVGLPTVRVETDFHAPSYCDDILLFTLKIAKIGRASATFEIRVTCEGEKRLTTRHTLAQVMLDEMKSIPFDADLRDGLMNYLTKEGAHA